MTWLHTWAGITFCWVLYIMFVTGTVGYFDNEIDHWMQPDIPIQKNVSLEQSLATAQAYLEKEVPEATNWNIRPVGGREGHQLGVFWQGLPPEEGEEQESGSASLDAATGLKINDSMRDTGGGQTLYRMHYLLHYIDRDIIYRIIGVITFLMFIGLISGVIIHRKIFTDFFTFRANKKSRATLDLHNLLSVSSLPFQIMITYSGLIFMVVTWMPLIGVGSYGFDVQKFQQASSQLIKQETIERSGNAAPVVNLTTIVPRIEMEADGASINLITVQQPGDENAIVYVNLNKGLQNRIGSRIGFDAVTGEFLGDKSVEMNPAVSFALTTIELHEGIFAGTYLRWLYFIAGIVGSAMIATGAIYWVQKRAVKASTEKLGRGHRFVENMNIGTIVGFVVAVGVYFIANRLLPLGMENRADWEVHCMYLTWLACLIHPIFRPKLQAWIEQCTLGGIVFASIPIINALTTSLHLGKTIPDGNWAAAGVDLVAITTAVAFFITAFVLKGKKIQVQSTVSKSLQAVG